MNRLTHFPTTGAEHGCDAPGSAEAPAVGFSFNGPLPETSNSISVEAGPRAVESLSPTAMLPREIRGGVDLLRPLETAAANPFPQSDHSNPPSPATEGDVISAAESSPLPGAEAPMAPDTFSDLPQREVCETANLRGHNMADADRPKDWAESPNKPLMRKVTGNESRLLQGKAPENLTARDSDWAEAEAKAQLCADFLQLTREGYSLRQAAKALGKGVAHFSGADSMLAQYQRGGVAALLPKRRECGAKATFAVPDWFIPAARFFWLLTNRTWNSGSVPEAVRRVISLPNLPVGWDATTLRRFLTAIGEEKQSGSSALPSCPAELRELILARERAGKPLVPERIARQITASARAVRQHRNPTEAGLHYLSSPGSIMWTNDAETGERRFTRAGDWMEADDGTINFPVCIPWTMGGCPTSDKFGVKVGRFQFLRPIDAGSRFRPGFLYVARPRGSYRREDVLALMRLVCRAHGVPRGWRFERGTWESNMVKEAVRLLGSQLQTVYSPRQKPFVEGGFNQDWTKLSVHFPRADVGRYMGETEEANDLLTKCKKATEDPRNHFPMLDDALKAFAAITREENSTPVNSANYGRWIPEERWREQLAANPLRRLSVESEWIFHPYVREWTVRGMLVGGRVPLFEEVSVPFDFSAQWLGQFDGAKVRCHFDPTEARCEATVVLLEPGQGTPRTFKRGDVLGTAIQINETAGYARLVMGWGDDPASLGRKLRQQTASAMRREVRAILPNGHSAGGESELRDGLGQKAVINHGGNDLPQVAEQNTPTTPRARGSASDVAPAEPTPFDRGARLAELDAQEAAMSHLFD